MEQILVCRICVKNKKLINISKTIPVKNGSKWSKDLFINIKEKLSYAYGITIDRKSKFNMVCINCIRIVNNVVLLKLQAVEAKKFLEDIQIMFKPGSSISSQDITKLYEKMKRTINTSKFVIPNRKRKKVIKKSGSPSTSLYGQYRNPNNKFVKKVKEMPNDDEQSIVDTQQFTALTERLSEVESNDSLTISNSNECAKTLNNEVSSLNNLTPSKENKYSKSTCVSNNTLKCTLNNSIILKEISEKSNHVLVNSSESDTLHYNTNVQLYESKKIINNKRFLINDTIPNNTESKLSHADLTMNVGSGRSLNKLENQNSYEGPDFTTKDNDLSQSECFIRIESVESLYETESKITNSGGLASCSLFTTNKRTGLIVSDKNNMYLDDSSSLFSSSSLGSSSTFNGISSNQVSDESILPPIFIEASSKQIYLCDYCPRNFTSKLYLNKHIRNIHLFSCPACKKSFQAQKHLNLHIRIKSCSIVADINTEPKAVDWKLYLKPIVRLVPFDNPAFVSTDINLSK